MPLYNLELNALQNYGSINSCVQAAPVLANISMVSVYQHYSQRHSRVKRCYLIPAHSSMSLNAPARIHFKRHSRNALIGPHAHHMSKREYALTRNVSFIQTNQTDVLNTPNLPSLVDNIRTVCSFTSTVLSNKTTSSSVPAPTQTSGAVAGIHFEVTMFVGGLIALVALFS